MTKDELWNAFLKRYPQFQDEEAIVKQTSRGLRRFMEQAWDEGYEKGKSAGQAVHQRQPKTKSYEDLFKPIFG